MRDSVVVSPDKAANYVTRASVDSIKLISKTQELLDYGRTVPTTFQNNVFPKLARREIDSQYRINRFVKLICDYRLIYRNYYMVPTLGCDSKSEPFKIRAWHIDSNGNNYGFPGKYIHFRPQGTKSNDILASTVVLQNAEIKQVCININPLLWYKSNEFKKRILAHEWIHAMAVLEGINPSPKRVSDHFNALLFFSTMGRKWLRPRWQDSEEMNYCMQSALRQLLVSKESIEEMLYCRHKLFVHPVNPEMLSAEDQTKENLFTLIENNEEEARGIISELITDFSRTWSVDMTLVHERLQEVLYE